MAPIGTEPCEQRPCCAEIWHLFKVAFQFFRTHTLLTHAHVSFKGCSIPKKAILTKIQCSFEGVSALNRSTFHFDMRNIFENGTVSSSVAFGQLDTYLCRATLFYKEDTILFQNSQYLLEKGQGVFIYMSTPYTYKQSGVYSIALKKCSFLQKRHNRFQHCRCTHARRHNSGSPHFCRNEIKMRLLTVDC